MKKKIILVSSLLIVGFILIWFRGTPDNKVPYPSFPELKPESQKSYTKRPIPYHEIFLGWRNWTNYHLIIYNDLNKLIKKDEWKFLKANPDLIKKQHGCDIVVFNGPRFWVLDKIESNKKGNPLGKILDNEMLTPAYFTFSIKQIKERVPYNPLTMNRNTKYTYWANDYLYKLISNDGVEYVMQAASQEVDSTLQLSDLNDLGDRLTNLPEGWKYKAEFITEDFTNIANGQTRIV